MGGVKWILRYFNGSRDVGILFGKCNKEDQVVMDYVDSDFAKDYDSGRSIRGCL